VTVTVTDLFAGGGGSSTGAEMVAGVEVAIAANHWQTAVDVHQVHFPDARHDCADLSQADPRRYPATNILLASPECTNHSQARGISRKRQDASLFDGPDPAAERSRSTMWDVGRFAEQLHYDAIVVENVVEATKWTGWEHWLGWLTSLGYSHKVLSRNSMHHGVPQSRDRIYVVFWRKGLKPNLEMEHAGWCERCNAARPCR
jgi:DNA (cytosine-5)-methyltransferase 1